MTGRKRDRGDRGGDAGLSADRAGATRARGRRQQPGALLLLLPPYLSPSFLPSLSSVPPHRPLGGPPAAAHIGAARVAGGTAHPSTRGLLSEKRRIPHCAAAMASVPSAGCLLAKNQYYRTRLNSESSVSSSSSCCSDAVNVTDQEKIFHGLPDLIDKYWWIKSFFHSEPSPPPVGRKTLSASSTNS
ncbi:pancreatic progenitor cell differentiation and proliferation factor-like protein isoform X1 [Neopelma chrysocephalum]|uniref:pancreatic progenitor cell differentiation and proliferation factor-like protein isoform X1 n=1 Tax=Neopelma chrysocephalum TaxID=114329 RepID=UPI000FCCE65A|nr:pancreatic progenitor cell differentiation and proliferation factor-like protein isoform X1 [Neopelma chrysocephalum]